MKKYLQPKPTIKSLKIQYAGLYKKLKCNMGKNKSFLKFALTFSIY